MQPEGFTKRPITSYLPPSNPLAIKYFQNQAPNGNNTNRSGSFSFNKFKPKTGLPFINSPKSKRLGLISAIIIVLAIVLTGWTVEAKRDRQYQERIAHITELEQQAKTASDQNSAREILKTALEELKTLSRVPKDQNADYQNLKNSLTIALQEVNQIHLISEPTLFIDFETVLKDKNINIKSLGLFNQILYVAEQTKQKIYKLDLEKFLISEADGPQGKMDAVSQILSSDSKVLFFNYQKDLFYYQPQKEAGFTVIDTQKAHANLAQTTYLAHYSNKLYTLNPTKNQIIRYPFNGWVNLDNGENWIQDSQIDLSKASSLAVDGDIYLTTTDDQILKLTSGKLVEFQADIHPPLQTSARIFTSAEHKYLYVLEPALYRLIILDKQGKLIIQINSPKFNNLRDFYPDEQNNIIYLLNGNKIYQVDQYLK